MPWANREQAAGGTRRVSRAIDGVQVDVYRRSSWDATELLRAFAPLAGAVAAIASGDPAAAAKLPPGSLRDLCREALQGVQLDGHDALNSAEGKLLVEEATLTELIKIVLFVVEVHRDPLAATRPGAGFLDKLAAIWRRAQERAAGLAAAASEGGSPASGQESQSPSSATGSSGGS